MINWDKELEKIFDDPLLADVTAPRKRTTSSDRLVAGFQEIFGFLRNQWPTARGHSGGSIAFPQMDGFVEKREKD